MFLRRGARGRSYLSPHYLSVIAVITDKNSFKGAYCTVYEKQALPELFGEMEVTADSLPEMAAGIIASEG